MRGKKAKQLRKMSREYAEKAKLDPETAYKAVKNLWKDGKVK